MNDTLPRVEVPTVIIDALWRFFATVEVTVDERWSGTDTERVTRVRKLVDEFRTTQATVRS